MVKTTQYLVTQGIQAVMQTFDVAPLFRIANKLHTDEQYFLSLKPSNGTTLVTDGNYEILATLDFAVPEPMYCIRDDFDEHYVTTLMLTYEY